MLPSRTAGAPFDTTHLSFIAIINTKKRTKNMASGRAEENLKTPPNLVLVVRDQVRGCRESRHAHPVDGADERRKDDAGPGKFVKKMFD